MSKTRLVFSLPGKCCAQLCLRCPIYSLILSTDVYKFGMVRGGKTGAANDLTGTLTTDLTVTETHIKVKNYFTSGISNWRSRLPGPRTFEAAWLSRSFAGSGCDTGVEHRPRNREVVGLNPARCWAFFFSFLSYQYWVHTQVPHGGETLLIFI